MTCKEARSGISAYLDGELALDARREFDLHVEVCAECGRELDSFRALDDEFRRGLPELEPHPSVFARVVEMRAHDRVWLVRWRLAWIVGTAAVVFLSAFFGMRQIEIGRQQEAILREIDSFQTPRRVTNVFALSRFEQRNNPFVYDKRVNSRRNTFAPAGPAQGEKPVSYGGQR